MNFRVEVSEFRDKLAIAVNAMERRTTIPILSQVLIQVSDSESTLTTTDLELGIRCKLNIASVQETGNICVPAERLLNYVKALPDGEVSVSADGKLRMTVRIGSHRAVFAGQSHESFPTLPEPSADASLTIDSRELAGMLRQAIISVSQHESRFTLNGCLAEVKDGILRIVATDSHRMSIVERKQDGEWRALIPTKPCRVLSALEDEGSIAVSSNDNHLFFQFPEWLMLSRKLSGNFPEWKRHIPETKRRFAVSRELLSKSIDRIAQFCETGKDSSRLIFKLTDNSLTVCGVSIEGEGDDVIPVEYSGEPLHACYERRYVQEFLRVADSENVAVDFSDAMNPFCFRPVETNGFRYVLAPRHPG